MAEIVAIIVGLLDAPGKVKKYVIDSLKVRFNYLYCSNSILDGLRAEVHSLENTRTSLQRRVDAARRNLEIIRPDVEEWLKRVDEIKIQTDRIFGAIPEVQQGCVNGNCPDLKLRYSVSRKAEKMAKAIGVEVQVAGMFYKVADPASPLGMEIIPVASCTEFDSRKIIEEEIMAALRDDRVYLIGICGMGGIGKTTMVKKIVKRASEENLFDVAAMVVVSQQPDLKRIQQEIAEALSLKLEQQTVSIRARLIHTRLMDAKRILIIIDDIWARLNLEELGIPSQSNHKGCKVILTSRIRHVSTEMEATQIFSLEGLLEKEAWALFKDNAGTCVDDRDLHQIAKDVVKECKGLPLALVTVGRALRGQKAKPVWEDALVQLQRSASLNIPGFLKDVYLPLELSYNHLESDEVRYLFLLCCLFPEDSRISHKDLLYLGAGLRIFSNVETLKEARNRVYGLLEMLESRYMLMDDGTYKGIKYVKMHDVIRDMAIFVASTGKHVFMTSHDTRLKDWPRKDSCENYTCISLTLKDDVTLPECINCPRLQILRMKFRWDGQLPDTFFDRMRKLNVLDIGHITSLPASIQLLTNLRTLSLGHSKMKTVSMIGQLVKLEILDLRKSELEVLPKEIGGLENLKSLDLSWCSHLREIAPGVISRLVRLEELFMLGSFQKWGTEVEGKERRNASLVEVASLKNLTALQIEIPEPKVLHQATLHWQKLERCMICIGTCATYISEDYDENTLILGLNETTPLVRALTRKAHCLELSFGGMGVSDEVIKLIQEENQNLKSLILNDCDNMKHLVLSNQNIIFPRLRSLFFSNCRDLEVICYGSAQAKSLSQLKILAIEECSVLEDIFKAERGGSSDVVSPIVFPSLTELSLCDLPSLNSFCKAVNGVEFPLLSTLHIVISHNLKVFCPVEESNFSEKGEHNSDSQFLFHQKVTFASLVELKLYNINNATKIFSSPIPIGSFSRLEQLEVVDCSKLEEVVGKEDEESQTVDKEPLFPKLKNLILSKLPSLKTFCRTKNDIELPQLESITIVDCHKMETFSLGFFSLRSLKYVFGLLNPNLTTQIFLNKKVTFASLVELKLCNIKSANEIFSSQIPIDSFSQLELLEVESCPNLKVIFSPLAYGNFRTLGKLVVKSCSKLEEVVGKEDEESQAAVKEPLVPKLRELILSELPNFKKFCHMTNDVELPQLESITIVDCDQMETFSLGSLSFPHLTRVFGSLDLDFAIRIFFKKEVTLANLVELKLYNINTATNIFSSQTPKGSFSQLELLEVESCPSLKVIFSPPAFRNFRMLGKLIVKNCSKLKKVVGKEDEESQTAIMEPLFPELKELVLSELPNFKKFCHLTNDIELSQLESITIVDCHKLETFSMGSLSLPRLTCVFGLLDPDLATQIFFKKETSKHGIHHKNDSFTLSVKDLLGFESQDDYFNNWEWCLAKDSSDNIIVVARLLRAWWLIISGRFEMVKLSPGTLYEVVFEMLLEDSGFQWESPINLTLTQLEGITQERHEDLEHQPRGKWIEILVGEFTTGQDPIGDLKFSLYHNAVTWGLLVKGVTIRSKASSTHGIAIIRL